MNEVPKLEMLGLLDIKGQDCIRRVYDPNGLSPTLTTCGGGCRQVKILDKKRYRVRKLTPTEYGRLQAFQMDNWEQVVSDSQAYKQFGNAVTTTVAAGVASSIATYLKKCGILEKEDLEIMSETQNTTPETCTQSTAMQEESPAIMQIMAILQPKKEQLAAVEAEEYRLKTEIEALELAISTIKNI